MAKRKHPPPDKPQTPAGGGRHATAIAAHRRPDGSWELIAPRCTVERQADLAEAQSMIEAGEHQIARDELRWLLQGCGDNMAAHRLLGELALLENDPLLARGHFGYAYEIGMKAIRRAGSPAPWPIDCPANAEFFSAGRGLVHCLVKLDKRELAAEVAEFLVRCEPRDPFKLRELSRTGFNRDPA